MTLHSSCMSNFHLSTRNCCSKQAFILKLKAGKKQVRQPWQAYDALYEDVVPSTDSHATGAQVTDGIRKQGYDKAGCSVLSWNAGSKGTTQRIVISLINSPKMTLFSCMHCVVLNILVLIVMLFYRQFQYRRIKHSSVVVYIRNSISKGLTIVRNHLYTLIWLNYGLNFPMTYIWLVFTCWLKVRLHTIS